MTATASRNPTSAPIVALVVCALVALAGFGATGAVADDERPVLRRDGSGASWSGEASVVATPVPSDVLCPLGPADPTCVHHAFDVEVSGSATLEATLTAATGVDLDLVLFTAAGDRVSTAASGDDPEVLHAVVDSGGYVLSVATWVSSGLSPQRFELSASLVDGPVEVSGPGEGCAFGTPAIGETASLSAERLSLRVLAPLDGVDVATAEAAVAQTELTYDDVGIDLHVDLDETFEASTIGVGPDFRGDDRPRADIEIMFDEVIAHYGGRVPDGYDAVVVMTAKNLVSGSADMFGVANCIGGLPPPTTAFALGEAWADEFDTSIGLHQTRLAGIIFAHELGHLANAPHHYGECTFGVGRADRGDVEELAESSCTLMQYIGPGGNTKLTTASTWFSHLNRLVVRNHVAAHAG